jgi:hypothetical protein
LYVGFTAYSGCSVSPQRSQADKLLTIEAKYAESFSTLKCLDSLNSAVKTNVLHRSHYLFFWSLDSIALELSELAWSKYFGGDKAGGLELYQSAFSVLLVAVVLLEDMIPTFHHENVVYYDRLAQLAVSVGQLERSIENEFA